MPLTPEQFEEVCKRISESRKSKRTICKELHIAGESIEKYIREIGDSAESRYARAKSDQAENILDEIYELEDQCKKEVDECEDPRKCNAIVQACKLKTDNLKWILSKLLPKKYGDKLDLTSGGDKLPIPPQTLTVVLAKENKDATD